MTASPLFQLLVSAVLAFLCIPVLTRLVRLFSVEVEHDEAVLISRFGQLVAPQSFAVCTDDSHGAAPAIQGSMPSTTQATCGVSLKRSSR